MEKWPDINRILFYLQLTGWEFLINNWKSFISLNFSGKYEWNDKNAYPSEIFVQTWAQVFLFHFFSDWISIIITYFHWEFYEGFAEK